MVNPLHMLKRWYRRKVTMYELDKLDDHLLADMGIERERIPEVAVAAELRERACENRRPERPVLAPHHCTIPAE